MENNELFAIEAQGYRCEDVENYISALKTEYKKVYEHATKVMSDNDKLKKICRALSDENKSLKAAAAEPAAPAVDPALAADVEKINAIIVELAKQGVALKEKVK